MRWPGTIQPSRFLSHTGKILPGVRRVVTIPQPAAGVGLVFVVPGGVQWWVGAGYFTLATDAVVGNRFLAASVTVDGLLVWNTWPGYVQPASELSGYGMQSTSGYSAASNNGARSFLPLPGEYLPEGAIVSLSINSADANDQLSALSLWVEEVYVTDPQLSEDARLHAELERDIAIYEYQQAEQAAGGT